MEQTAPQGIWITDDEFAALTPQNVFSREIGKVVPDCTDHRDRHILFRKRFFLVAKPKQALLRITADDYYKAWLNGRFAGQGPAAAYPQRYGYNVLDVTDLLREGENVLAVHTLYQGLINRVWVSGDNRHGLLCDLLCDGVPVLQSDETFHTARHTGFRETGVVGYDTQFLESYDSAAPEVGFEQPDFDDSGWAFAMARSAPDYVLAPQQTKMLTFETVAPRVREVRGSTVFLDFGGTYVGYLQAEARGVPGSAVTVRCGQELEADGSVRYRLRANCVYEESWMLSGGEDRLDWFDFKSFRYVELTLPEGCRLGDVTLLARHYPFCLTASMGPAFAADPELRRVWELCVNTLHYGVQEVIQDCMEREKGFYVGDACYTALTHMVLTGDDSIVRKLIGDAFASSFITPTLMTCLDCSFMQEIAEYSLMLIPLLLQHYRLLGDRAFLASCYPLVCRLLDTYRRDYERDGLLRNLDKWCVVEWPANFRDGYDVDLTQGKVCQVPHVVMNAYYLEAIRCANAMAAALEMPPYRDRTDLLASFTAAFYDPTRKMFRDSTETDHISYIGNVFPYAYGLCPDEGCRLAIEGELERRGITDVGLFGAFPMLEGFVRYGREDLLRRELKNPGAWLRMLREGATTTFEGWGKDTKWNTSLFHLTMSDGALFLADLDLKQLLI